MNTYINEFRVEGGHGAKIKEALDVLQVPGAELVQDSAGELIRVPVPAGVDTLEHWRALRVLRDAIVAKAEAEGPAPR